MEIIKVSSKSNSNNVAGALANLLKKEDQIEVQVIGAGALNQLVKSIIICRGLLAPTGKNLTCIPSFVETYIDDKEKTAIKIQIKVC